MMYHYALLCTRLKLITFSFDWDGGGEGRGRRGNKTGRISKFENIKNKDYLNTILELLQNFVCAIISIVVVLIEKLHALCILSGQSSQRDILIALDCASWSEMCVCITQLTTIVSRRNVLHCWKVRAWSVLTHIHVAVLLRRKRRCS